MPRLFPKCVGAPPVHTPSHPLLRQTLAPAPIRSSRRSGGSGSALTLAAGGVSVVPSGSELRSWGHRSWGGHALSLKVRQG